ncbi:response regulator [Picosynechococcus sp. NKBG15041c]|uniref:response regulator n=1 Tax=Picosynechococcus sp. NKBG15041c TaxID=1407650 RepID=UPI0006877726
MRVKDMLPDGNFEVIEAKNGLEGFNLINTEHPNLIMLDFLLPKMSGWEVYQEIQKRPELKAIPLVLMSGRKEEVTEKLPEPFEEFSFIEKPFDQKQLINAIKEAMAKAKKYSQTLPTQSIPGRTVDTTGDPMAAEIVALQSKVNALQGEIEVLRKQMGQLVSFVKQKLK